MADYEGEVSAVEYEVKLATIWGDSLPDTFRETSHLPNKLDVGAVRKYILKYKADREIAAKAEQSIKLFLDSRMEIFRTGLANRVAIEKKELDLGTESANQKLNKEIVALSTEAQKQLDRDVFDLTFSLIEADNLRRSEIESNFQTGSLSEEQRDMMLEKSASSLAAGIVRLESLADKIIEEKEARIEELFTRFQA